MGVSSTSVGVKSAISAEATFPLLRLETSNSLHQLRQDKLSSGER